MNKALVKKRLSDFFENEMPKVTEVKQEDMPKSFVKIKGDLPQRAELIINELVRLLPEDEEKFGEEKTVITICGGSGVGKTSIAAIISYVLKQVGIGCYTLSGDHYPRRIPEYNDAERLWLFRENGMRELAAEGLYSRATAAAINRLQKANEDANPKNIDTLPELKAYLKGGRKGLEAYLGTPHEQNFDEVNKIISDFKNGSEKLCLRRMGRKIDEISYEITDFKNVNILLIEWTHGFSDYLKGIDMHVLLNSTPAETLAFRKARNRDGNIDSPFTSLVLDIEQRLLINQASKADIILSRDGKLISHDEYDRLMEEGGLND